MSVQTYTTVRQLRSSVAYRALARTVKHEEHTCWLCLEPIDVTIPYRDPETKRVNPDCWSLDHIVPISKRPDLGLIRDLCRAAHFRCNSQRGNRAPGLTDRQPLRTSRAW